jgi:hypothetical protein
MARRWKMEGGRRRKREELRRKGREKGLAGLFFLAV